MSSFRSLQGWLNGKFKVTCDSVTISHGLLTIASLIIYYTILQHIMRYIKNRHVIPICLLATTNYATFIEQVLIVNELKYLKIFQPYLTDREYMLATHKKTISVNPGVSDFIDGVIEFDPLTDEELEKLSLHLGLNITQQVQMDLLEKLPDINAHHIVRQDYCDADDYGFTYSQVQSLTIDGTHLRIATPEGVVYSSKIITDKIDSLKPGEIIVKSYFNTSTQSIIYDQKYAVSDHLELESLRKNLISEDIEPLPFYSLNRPRTGLILHPFHLPDTRDFILSIMLATQAIVNSTK